MQSEQESPLSVSELTAHLKSVLETEFSGVWVAGEISDLARPKSGHVYLTLKDDLAQLRGVVWRSTANRLKFDLADGLEVVCSGDIDIYPPRGSYQIVIRQIEPRGIGALELAFRQLHQKMAGEGLFDERHKRPLPPFPQRIGVVTSPTGAAIRDFLQVLDRRWTGIEVTVIPCHVQGADAAEEISAAIRLANSLRTPLDVLVVGRGGGSAEDLWCFNEEVVVRAIYNSQIPVISAVGHEIDVTLADLVADVRAATPSEAAEIVVPNQREIRERLGQLRLRMANSLEFQLNRARGRLDAVTSRRLFQQPFDLLLAAGRRIDELDSRLSQGITGGLDRSREQLLRLGLRLDGLSPLSILGRGYSITTDRGDRVLTGLADLSPGDQIQTTLARGKIHSRIERLTPPQMDSPTTDSTSAAAHDRPELD